MKYLINNPSTIKTRAAKKLLALFPQLLLTVAGCWTAAVQADTDSLADLTLDDLMNIEMVSGSKLKQELSDVTAAAYVITEDDIKNAGVTSLPELLKMVPGLFIAQASANSWAVGIRGFPGVFSNKMLVMIDGRSLFSPLFSGVFWEQVDLYLPDIERIEVIRGAGSTLWGANAVNGVINIITKSTLDNQSSQLYANTGSQLNYDAGVRFGAKIADQSYARVYLKSKSIDGSRFATASDDSWSSDAIGAKWEHFAGRDSFLVSADYLEQSLNDTTVLTSRINTNQIPTDNTNGNLSFQWQRQISTDRAFTLSAQIQQSERLTEYYSIDDHMVNLEFDTSYQWQDHLFSFGVGGRSHDIDFDPGNVFDLEAHEGTRNQRNTIATTDATILSAYFQDEWRFASDHSVIFGTKFESHQHDYGHTNEEYNASLWLPTLRYRLDLSDSSRFWAAVSHSARIPSVAEHIMQIPTITLPPGSPPNPFSWSFEQFTSGDHAFNKETILSFEAGFRAAINSHHSIDIVAYHNRYNDVRGFTIGPAICRVSQQPAPLCALDDQIDQHVTFNNGLSLSINGVELTWLSRFSDTVNLSGSYSYMNQVADPIPANVATNIMALVLAPQHQFALQADWQGLESLNLGFKYKYLGRYKQRDDPLLSGPNSRFLKRHHSVDMVALYDLSAQWKAKFNITNLFQQRGQEWLPEFPNSTTSETERRFALGLEVTF